MRRSPKQQTRPARGETLRLAALRRLGILDTPPEEAFDGIVRMAARICGTPAAALSLVDESRAWFKAQIGLDRREVPRPASLEANPFAGEFRFYAGAPLVTRSGAVLGTLCVMDSGTREINAEHHDALRDLARQAVAEMELRADRSEFAARYRQTLISAAPRKRDTARDDIAEDLRRALAEAEGRARETERRARETEQALKEREDRLRAIVESEPECVKVLDAEGRLEEMNAAGLRMIEADSAAAVVGHCVYGLVKPEYRAQFRAATERVCRGEGEVHLEFEIVGLKGTPRWLETHAVPLPDPVGGKIRMLGVTRDITERKRAESALRERERELRVIMDSVPVMISRADRDERYVFVNRAYERLMERTSSELLGRSIREMVSDEVYAQVKPDIDRVLAGDTVRFERAQRRSDGEIRHLDVLYVPDVDEKGRRGGWFALHWDVTEEHRARRALAASEARFRSLTALSSDWFWEEDDQYRLVFMSEGAEARLGMHSASRFGKTRWELPTVGVSDEQWLEHRSRLQRREAFRGFEYGRLNASGQIVWFAISGEPVFSASGRFKGYRGVGRDITSQKRAEQELRQSESRFRSLTALSSDWYWEQDAEFRQTFLSDGYESASGAQRTTILGTRRWERTDVTPLSCTWQTHRETLEAHLPFKDFEYLRQTGDGRQFYVSLSGEPVFNSDGAFTGYRGLGRDITVRKRGEQLLRLEHQIASALSEAEDAAGGVKTVLQSVCETEDWGCGRYFKLDERAGVLRFEDGWSLPQPPYVRFLEESHALEFRPGQGLAGIVWQNGEPVWSSDTTRDPRVLGKALAGSSGLRGAFAFGVVAEGKIIGVLSFSGQSAREPDLRLLQSTRVIGSQIGQFLSRKRAENSLAESEARLQRMNVELEERVAERTVELRAAVQELDAFTYSVSHDLRAPVGAVSGFAHILRIKEADRLSEDGRHLLGVVEQNAERMVNLIEGLLRFSRLGRSDLHRVRLSMNELAGEALLDFAEDAAKAEVRAEPMPDCEGDRTLLGQVWANLIGNALKYSRGDDAPRVQIGWDAGRGAYFVRDNGVGFDMAYAGKLFGVFERLHGEGEFEGSGIGLAIAERIVKRHGGTIWAEAAPEQGATFWFTVPDRGTPA